MNPLDVENAAGIARATCGWKKPQLPLDAVRRFWRDVHSPAIARRDGVYDYRHFQFDPVDAAVLPRIEGVETRAAPDQQLMWTSDVRYRDEAGLARFGASPPDAAKRELLADIDLIVDQSTTYKAVGDNARTFKDISGDAQPQGAPTSPHFALFLRARAPEAQFRSWLRDVAQRWAAQDCVLRLRLSLFDAPDMEAERKAGYPVKTHPVELQYQAWIDIVLQRRADLALLVSQVEPQALKSQLRALHAYPVAARYTSNYGGRPTIVGLRGYPAWLALTELGAAHHGRAPLLDWMYGTGGAQESSQ